VKRVAISGRAEDDPKEPRAVTGTGGSSFHTSRRKRERKRERGGRLGRTYGPESHARQGRTTATASCCPLDFRKIGNDAIRLIAPA